MKTASTARQEKGSRFNFDSLVIHGFDRIPAPNYSSGMAWMLSRGLFAVVPHNHILFFIGGSLPLIDF